MLSCGKLEEIGDVGSVLILASFFMKSIFSNFVAYLS